MPDMRQQFQAPFRSRSRVALPELYLTMSQISRWDTPLRSERMRLKIGWRVKVACTGSIRSCCRMWDLTWWFVWCFGMAIMIHRLRRPGLPSSGTRLFERQEWAALPLPSTSLINISNRIHTMALVSSRYRRTVLSYIGVLIGIAKWYTMIINRFIYITRSYRRLRRTIGQ